MLLGDDGEGPRDPTKPFWMALTFGSLTGDAITSVEGLEGFFDTEEAAADAIKALLREHGSQGFVYRCVPVLSVSRQPRVKRLKTPPNDAEGGDPAAELSPGNPP
jgi:hypothetical protein